MFLCSPFLFLLPGQRKRNERKEYFDSVLLLKRPYIFFTLFAACWVVLLLPIVAGLISIRAGSAVYHATASLELLCWFFQLIFGIVYWISLYKTRNQPHAKRFRLNLTTVLLTLVAFYVFASEALPMLLWAMSR